LPSDPLVLGFDTSAAHCAVALVCGDLILRETVEDMARGQAERLMPLITEVLASASREWQDLAAIGVGTGPGNFTGIRLSVSAARGLALALGIPAIGVPVFEALAEGVERPIVASIDARRDELFLCRLNEPQPATMALVAKSGVSQPDFAGPSMYVGFECDDLAARYGGIAAASPFGVASAIARIAARRLGTPQPRPAPVYIRAPHAMPSRT